MLRRIAVAFLLALGIAGGCADASRLGGPPPAGRAEVVVPRAAVFMQQTGGSAPAFVNNVRVRLLRADGSVAVDTVVAFAENLDELVISLTPQMTGSSETFAATVQLRNGTSVLLETTGPVTAVPASQPPPPPAPLPAPVPPGNAVLPTAVSIQPQDTTVFEGDSVAFRVTGVNGQTALTSFTYTLTPREADVRTSPTGFVRTPLRRGGGWVVVRAPGAPPTVRDSAFLRFQPRPTGLQVVSGNNQSATILTALSAPLVARVVGRDGQGVSGVTVTFTPPTGTGYAVGNTTAVSNANGLVQTTATVGSVAQAANFRASIASTSITADFSATGTPGAAVALRFTQAPSTSQRAVAPFEVRVRGADVGGNTTDLPAATSVALAAEVAGTALPTFNATSATPTTGTAVFAARAITRAASAVQLVATATGLTTARATAFDVVTGPAAAVSKIDGDNQVVTVGTAVPTVPRVRVVDDLGAPVGGVAVTFAPAAGSGTVVGGSTTTTATGEAGPTSWTVGNLAGAQSLNATVGTLPVQTFSATATAGAATQLLADAGAASTGTVAVAVTPLPRAKVADAFGNGVSGVTVTFRKQANRGTITDSVRTSDASGLVTLGSWLAGTLAGEDTVLASTTTPALGPRRFIVTLAPGAAAAIVKTLGDAQNGAASTALPDTLAVRVNDGFGNPVPGVSVTFTLAGGGSLTRTTAVTDAEGRAGPGSWTLGASGTQTVTATVGSLSTTFTASLGVGIPTTVTLGNTGPLAGTVGEFRFGITATVVDGAGQPMPGVVVRLRPQSARSGTIVFGDSSATTNAAGVATFSSYWRLDTLPGVDTLRAVVLANPVVLGRVIVTTSPGPLWAVRPVNFNAPSPVVRAGTALAPMQFESVDQFGNRLANQVAVFSYRVQGADSGFVQEQQLLQTDASGLVTFSGWQPVVSDADFYATLVTSGSCAPFASCPTYSVAARVAFAAARVARSDTTWSKSAPVSTAIASPIRARVLDRRYTEVPGAVVSATIVRPQPGPGGSVVQETEVQTLTSDDSGWVSVAPTLGAAPGINVVTLTVGSSVVRYTVTGVGGAGPAVRLIVDTLAIQSADSGATVATLPRFRAVDAAGAPVAGIAVTFQTQAPAGSLQNLGAVVTTGANGIASPSAPWALSTTRGYHRIVASASGVTATEAGVLARGNVAAIQALAFPNFSYFDPGLYQYFLRMRVVDADGVGKPNVTTAFTFTAPSSPPPSQTTTTDGQGVALATWSYGQTVGTYTVTVTAGVATIVISTTVNSGGGGD